ncbi:MFS transporter [Mesorhizobium sp. M1217]
MADGHHLNSDVMVALVQTSTTLPVFLLSIFAGAITDNFSRRIVMALGWWLSTPPARTSPAFTGLHR